MDSQRTYWIGVSGDGAPQGLWCSQKFNMKWNYSHSRNVFSASATLPPRSLDTRTQVSLLDPEIGRTKWRLERNELELLKFYLCLTNISGSKFQTILPFQLKIHLRCLPFSSRYFAGVEIKLLRRGNCALLHCLRSLCQGRARWSASGSSIGWCSGWQLPQGRPMCTEHLCSRCAQSFPQPAVDFLVTRATGSVSGRNTHTV